MLKRLCHYLYSFFVLILMVSCGGGTEGTGDGSSTINSKVISIGSITNDDSDQNSVVVNGVEYDTSNAEVTIDDQSASADQLALGQVVVVSGTVDESGVTGTANTIIYNTTVFGPINEINDADKTVHILGQTIHINEETVYAGIHASSLGDIETGDHLRVTGFRLSNGDLSATLIEKVILTPDPQPGGDNNLVYEVNGLISNLDIDAMTFMVNDLVVDYSRITTLDTLEDGMRVEVIGIDYSRLLNLETLGSEIALAILNEVFNDQDQFIAVTITPLSDPISTAKERIELEGFVTAFFSQEDFEINEARIITDNDTVYIGGTIDNLNLNKKIEVEGRLNADDALVADKIIFLAASLTSHNSGDRLDSDVVTFSWSDVGADEYRLHILSGGTEIIHNAFYDKQTTSVIIRGLPRNAAHLTVTLYSKRGELWLSQAYGFISQSDLSNAELTSHVTNEVLTSDTVTFTWSDVGADQYLVELVGSGNVIHRQSYSGDTTSITLNNLPSNGVPLSLMLATRHGQGWVRRHYQLWSQSVLENAELTSHVNQEVLSSDTVTFTWSDVGADEYRIELRNNLDNRLHDQVYSGDITSATLDNLPRNGAPLSLTIFTRHGQGWQDNNYQLFSQRVLENAELTSHVANEMLASDSVTFIWSDVGADEYQITLTNYFNNELHNQSYSGDITSVTLNNLPINSAPLRLTIATRHGQAWVNRVYPLISQAVLNNAELTSHVNNEVLMSNTATFIWEDVEADEYEVWLSSGRIVLHSQRYRSDVTSFSIDNLPSNGAPLRLTLTTHHGRGYVRRHYNLLSQATLDNAELISHVNNEVLVSGETVFTWEDVGADEYWIRLAGDSHIWLHNQYYDGDTTSIIVRNLPVNGTPLSFSVSTRHGNGWATNTYNLVSFTAD